MNDHLITVLYTFIDDFFKSFFKTKLWNNLNHYWINKRGPKKKLSLSEVATLKFENFFFTPGNVHDNQNLDELLAGIDGLFTCDAGYLLKEEDLMKFFEENKSFYTATRKNMKKIMTKEQHASFKARSIIETAWGVLKERFELVFKLARSIHGLFRHYFYSLTSYIIKKIMKQNFLSFSI